MAEEPAAKTTLLALSSVLSCLVSELSKKGLIDVHDLTLNIQATAAGHRQKGNQSLANDMHALSEYLLKTVRDAPPNGDRP